MEGWEDDGWGNFDYRKQPQQAPPTAQAPPSSGGDFFDTFHGGLSSKPKEKDYFADFGSAGVSSSLSARKERTPPPPVSAALFGSGEKKTVNTSDGWGEWDSDFGSTKPQVRHPENAHFNTKFVQH